MSYKIAETRAERDAAFRLVYDAYTANGLILPNPTRMRVTRYQLLPSSTVFLAIRQGRALYTVSLIGDAELGVPLEHLYAEEVAAMRARGRRIGEVSCLAGRGEMPDGKQGFEIYVNLIGLMLQYARFDGMHGVLLAVHPKHAKFYQRFFGCEIFGELKYYEAVCGKPAMGCYHDFAALDKTGYPLHDRIYRLRYAPRMLLPHPMSPEERAHYQPMTAYAASGFLPTVA